MFPKQNNIKFKHWKNTITKSELSLYKHVVCHTEKGYDINDVRMT